MAIARHAIFQGLFVHQVREKLSGYSTVAEFPSFLWKLVHQLPRSFAYSSTFNSFSVDVAYSHSGESITLVKLFRYCYLVLRNYELCSGEQRVRGKEEQGIFRIYTRGGGGISFRRTGYTARRSVHYGPRARLLRTRSRPRTGSHQTPRAPGEAVLNFSCVRYGRFSESARHILWPCARTKQPVGEQANIPQLLRAKLLEETSKPIAFFPFYYFWTWTFFYHRKI